MASKASHKKTTVDVIKQQKRTAKRLAGQARQSSSGVSAASSSSTSLAQSSQGGSAGTNNAASLKTAGGSMMGPIAFYPRTAFITNDTINISNTTSAFSSRISITGQTTADDLKQIDGANNAGQILFLQSITGQTITLKHHTGSSGGGNINIPGGADYVMGAQDIVLLQWDTINPAYSGSGGQWTLVSSSSGSSLLSSTNTWTGINTFQANVSFTGATTTIGDANTDLCTIYAKMGTDVNMGTYDINTLDRLLFDVNGSDAIGSSDYGIGAEAAGGSTVGLIYSTPASKTHKFNIGGTPELTISNSYISAASKRITNVSTPTGNNDAATKAYVDTNGGSSWNGNATSDLDMNTYDINTIDRLLFNTGGSDSIGSSDYGIGAEASGGSVVGMIFSVPSNKTHKFSIGGTPELTISNSYISAATKRITNVTDPSGAQDAATKAYVDANSGGSSLLSSSNNWSANNTFNGVFETTTTTKLGNGSNDNIEIHGKTDYKNNHSTITLAAAPLPIGYITIKISGTQRRFYYYAG